MATLQLNQRERLGVILAAGALLLVAFLLVYIPMGPRRNYIASRDAVLSAQRELATAKLMKLDAEARRQSQEILVSKLKARAPGFDLLTFVDGVITETGLRNNNRNPEIENFRLRSADDRQPMVTVRLNNVSLRELVDFLHRIYASDNVVALYKLDDLSPASNGQGLNCNLTLVTLRG